MSKGEQACRLLIFVPSWFGTRRSEVRILSSRPNFGEMCFTYVLYSVSGDRYYVGHTNDTDRRLVEHNSRLSRSTKSGAPWALVHSEPFSTRKEAVARERQIKSWKSRRLIEDLLASAQHG